MTDGFLKRKGEYNPDVLSCLANLSNDEVFTPPEVANRMLDLLPQKVFRDPNAKFLDIATKTGVFLREIAKRLMVGLAEVIPDENKRREHIFKKQLFGIAITELTALMSRRSVYCSKDASCRYSIVKFKSPEGNIRFKPIRHKWENGRCVFCGASRKANDRDAALETHAYEFIHTVKPEEIFTMHFDVIIGNPPYQLSDGGENGGAIPIYNIFVEQAMKLQPRFLVMIIPARWYGGGRGLEDFREKMIHDRRIRELHDTLDAAECFGSGVEIKGGICYFLWKRDSKGPCKVVTHKDGIAKAQPVRELCEPGSDVFIRYAEGVSIYHKVKHFGEKTLDVLVSSQKPFGLRTFVHGEKESFRGAVKLYERGGVGYVKASEIEKNVEWVMKNKVFISAAYNAGDMYPHQIIGKPIFGEKGSACTETYVVIGPFRSGVETRNVMSYISTRFFRFLVMLKKTSQHAAASVYSFVPMQDFSKVWTDEELYKKYKLTGEEIAFIESMIRPMDVET